MIGSSSLQMDSRCGDMLDTQGTVRKCRPSCQECTPVVYLNHQFIASWADWQFWWELPIVTASGDSSGDSVYHGNAQTRTYTQPNLCPVHFKNGVMNAAFNNTEAWNLKKHLWQLMLVRLTPCIKFDELCSSR